MYHSIVRTNVYKLREFMTVANLARIEQSKFRLITATKKSPRATSCNLQSSVLLQNILFKLEMSLHTTGL